MYGEGVRGMGQEPGFMVVKKNEAPETAKDEPVTDLNNKEWEVRPPEPLTVLSPAPGLARPWLSTMVLSIPRVARPIRGVLLRVYLHVMVLVLTVQPCVFACVFCAYVSCSICLYLMVRVVSVDFLLHSRYFSCVNTCLAWKCATLNFQPKCFACLCNC